MLAKPLPGNSPRSATAVVLTAVTALASSGAPSFAQSALSHNTMSTALSFNDCMRRAEATMRQSGFEAQRGDESLGGTYGPFTAQIICAPTE